MTFLDPTHARKALGSSARPDVTFITPREIKGRKVVWAVVEGDIGRALVAVCDGAICWLSMDDKGDARMRGRFFDTFAEAQLFEKELPIMRKAMKANPPELPLLLIGTPFQHSVWRLLLRIPRGHLVRYMDVAAALKKPRAARAVGNAVGSNTVGWLVPCHRVGHSNGSLHGFGWGEACKRRFLGLEINGPEAGGLEASAPALQKNRASSKARAAAA